MRCEANRKDGKRCNNAPMRGARLCGPHQDALERGSMRAFPVTVRKV